LNLHPSLAHLQVIDSDTADLVALVGDKITIGRSSSCDIVVTCDLTASRLHAILEKIAEYWFIRDLGSRNGTFRNGRPTRGLTRLNDGDELRIGRARFAVRTPQYDEEDTGVGRLPPILTPRERSVLLELVSPISSDAPFIVTTQVRDIAPALGITTAAVRAHLLNLYEKFGIDTEGNRQLKLANAALRAQVVTEDEVRLGQNRRSSHSE
jgi:pSer/pThr/pTyr-binding forkhead associated (FHA) protein